MTTPNIIASFGWLHVSHYDRAGERAFESPDGYVIRFSIEVPDEMIVPMGRELIAIVEARGFQSIYRQSYAALTKW